MKKSLFLILNILFLPLAINGQATKEITLTYNGSDFTINTIDGLSHITSSIHSLSFVSDAQTPALPYIGVNVLIGRMNSYKSFSYTYNQQLFASHVNMSPNMEAVPMHLSPVTTTIDNIEYDNIYYPEEHVIYTGTHFMDGYKFLSFLVCPFKYDVANQKLYISTSIVLNISLNSDSNAPGIVQQESIGNTMRQTVKNMIINKEEINSLYQQSALPISTNYNYIVVTRDSLKSAFQRLANWKTQKGVKAKVLTIEEINDTYTGSTQQLRIKKALKDYYDGNYKGLLYVLLGGDVSIVPSLKCYIEYTYRRLNKDYQKYDTLKHYVDSTPTDLYYACFNTMDWDTNGNGKYGEIDDNVDIYPEIYISRLPATNLYNAENMVNRILCYEKNPDYTNWKDRILMAGAASKDTIYYENGVGYSDAQHKGNRIYNNYIAPYWAGQRTRFYDTDTDFPEGGNYTLNSSHFQNELQKGYNFVYMDTHGSNTLWQLEKYGVNSHYYYSYNSAEILQNSGNTFIVTSACNTNRIDAATCLSKSFMKGTNSGVLAYFGSSRYGWYTSNLDYLGPSNTINAELFKNLFTSLDNCFVQAAQEAKISHNYSCNSYENVYRWLLFSLNPLCDPEMPVYLSTPKEFTDVDISIVGNDVSVNTGISSCRVTAMSLSDNGETYYSVNNYVSDVTFSNIPSGCSICITKPGYIPYVVNYYDTGYVQNESVSTNKTIVANAVYIGSDVTTLKGNGSVVVESGKTTINANSVYIKNDFEVKVGAQFEVK